MKRIRDFFRRYAVKVTTSIAFYPSLISSAFFLLALAMLLIEYKEYMGGLRDFLSPILVKTIEDARLILGTLVGSIISLMVFSFSMVMIVLNRASSTLTPRVIPGLISRKSHQVVLGFYLGTIIYSLILIINIHPVTYETTLPSIGVLLSLIFGITSLALFIYFIDDISSAIQTDNILQEIFKNTREKMSTVNIDKEDMEELPDTSGWHDVHVDRTGYLKQIRIERLLQIASEHDLVVSIEENIGFFMVLNYPFLHTNREVEEEIQKELLKCFVFYTQEHVGDHYLFGFKQISEIAVKALSPGINDPGTAIKAIDLLSILFINKMKLNERRYVKDESGKIRIWYPGTSLETLLYDNLTPIREYGKNDATIMLKLLGMMKNLGYADIRNRDQKAALTDFVESLISSCGKYVDNSLDKKHLNKAIREVRRVLDTDLQEI